MYLVFNIFYTAVHVSCDNMHCTIIRLKNTVPSEFSPSNLYRWNYTLVAEERDRWIYIEIEWMKEMSKAANIESHLVSLCDIKWIPTDTWIDNYAHQSGNTWTSLECFNNFFAQFQMKYWWLCTISRNCVCAKHWCTCK